jgi:hypothetical protein
MITLLVIVGVVCLALAVLVQLYAQQGGAQLSGFFLALGCIALAASILWKLWRLTDISP